MRRQIFQVQLGSYKNGLRRFDRQFVRPRIILALGVAQIGDDQHLRSVSFKIVRRFDGVAGHGLDRLRPVGEASGIAEIGVIRVRDEFK